MINQYVRATIIYKLSDASADKQEALYQVESELQDLPGVVDVLHSTVYRTEEVSTEDEDKAYQSWGSFGFLDREEMEEEIKDEETGEILQHAFPCYPSYFPEDSERHRRYRQFVREMLDAGIPCRFYSGRGSYEGPAVYCHGGGYDYDGNRPTEDDVRVATNLSLTSDNLGKSSIILYPR